MRPCEALSPGGQSRGGGGEQHTGEHRIMSERPVLGRKATGEWPGLTWGSQEEQLGFIPSADAKSFWK